MPSIDETLAIPVAARTTVNAATSKRTIELLVEALMIDSEEFCTEAQKSLEDKATLDAETILNGIIGPGLAHSQLPNLTPRFDTRWKVFLDPMDGHEEFKAYMEWYEDLLPLNGRGAMADSNPYLSTRSLALGKLMNPIFIFVILPETPIVVQFGIVLGSRLQYRIWVLTLKDTSFQYDEDSIPDDLATIDSIEMKTDHLNLPELMGDVDLTLKTACETLLSDYTSQARVFRDSIIPAMEREGSTVLPEWDGSSNTLDGLFASMHL